MAAAAWATASPFVFPSLGPESILTQRRWVPLILVNLGGLALAAGWSIAAVTLIALWALDILTRVIDLVQLPD